jgi:hypothetical protein
MTRLLLQERHERGRQAGREDEKQNASLQQRRKCKQTATRRRCYISEVAIWVLAQALGRVESQKAKK